MRAEYKKSAVLGDVIQPIVYRNNEKYVVTLNGKEEKFAVIELTLRA